MTIFRTPKGTELELIKLKSKDYMLVAQRLVWFTEEVKNYTIESEFLLLDEEQTVCRTVVTILNENGGVIRRASATKRETKKDFPDHTEKSETGSLGRALAMLSFGTAQAMADFDEMTNVKGEQVNRLADSPLSGISSGTTETKVETKKESKTDQPKSSGFKRPAPKAATVSTGGSEDGWQ